MPETERTYLNGEVVKYYTKTAKKDTIPFLWKAITLVYNEGPKTRKELKFAFYPDRSRAFQDFIRNLTDPKKDNRYMKSAKGITVLVKRSDGRYELHPALLHSDSYAPRGAQLGRLQRRGHDRAGRRR